MTRLVSEEDIAALNAESICVIHGGRLYIDDIQVLDRNVEVKLRSLVKVLGKWAAQVPPTEIADGFDIAD